jgi:type IV pilus assembly protein PilW
MPSIKQSGFSLVELMVASTIGLMLVISLTSLFLSSKQANEDTERRGFLYDNVRYALNALSRDLRATDFWGHARPADVTVRADVDAIASDCSNAAAGYDIRNALWASTAASATVAACITDATVSSDILSVKHVARTPTAAANLLASQTYVASNYTTALLFDGADTPPGLATGAAVPGGQYWEYHATLYYVAPGTDGVPTLFRRLLSGNTWGNNEEVAAGVERMRVLFGIDTSGDGVADSYVNAAAADWGKAVSAKIYLLMRTENADATFTDTKTYQLGDIVVDPNPDDHYHRAVFDTTVTLRNRQLLLAGGF